MTAANQPVSTLGQKILKALRNPRAIVDHYRFVTDPAGPRVVRISATGTPRRGTAILSYLTDAFRPGAADHYHSNRWECRCMAETLAAHGYDVEAIDFDNSDYQPSPETSLVVDLHSNLERFATSAPSAKRVLHATGAHWEFQNRAERERLDALERRRGIVLPSRRQVPPSRGIDAADFATTTGNAFTIDTFAFAGKRMDRVPVTSTCEGRFPSTREHAYGRNHVLWIGSHGLVHKGLDLVLEAVARTPSVILTVVGPLDAEPDFCAAFDRELHLPNVRLAGWLDTRSREFARIIGSHAAVVYPSCSEGGGGSVINCLFGGLIPITTREASVDIGDFGISIETGTVDAVAASLGRFAALGAEEIGRRSDAALEFVRRNHSRENFSREFRRAVELFTSVSNPSRG